MSTATSAKLAAGSGLAIHRSAIYLVVVQRGQTNLSDLGRFEEPAVLILTSLVERPRHGYAIVKDVEAVAGVTLGPGTLYATLSRLEKRGLIEALPSDDRRRPYRITGAGRQLVRGRLERMGAIARTGLERLAHA
jgi:DNA-binding PadR family transcriptional regulator